MAYLVGVRERRRKTGIKVGTFVADLPCSRSHLMSVENGSKPASPELTVMIAERLTALGVPTEATDLLPVAGEKKEPGTTPAEPPPQPEPATSPPPRRREKAGKAPQRVAS